MKNALKLILCALLVATTMTMNIVDVFALGNADRSVKFMNGNNWNNSQFRPMYGVRGSGVMQSFTIPNSKSVWTHICVSFAGGYYFIEVGIALDRKSDGTYDYYRYYAKGDYEGTGSVRLGAYSAGDTLSFKIEYDHYDPISGVYFWYVTAGGSTTVAAGYMWNPNSAEYTYSQIESTCNINAPIGTTVVAWNTLQYKPQGTWSDWQNSVNSTDGSPNYRAQKVSDTAYNGVVVSSP